MGGIGRSNGGGPVTHPDCRPENLEAASVLCRSGLDDVTSVVHAIDVGLMLPFYTTPETLLCAALNDLSNA